MNKYTVFGSEAIEHNISNHMDLIVHEVLSKLSSNDLIAIILGGGYGRGEGGVVFDNGIEKPFNDYDLFIITQNLPNRKIKRYKTLLAELSKELSQKLSIDVDFSPLQPISVLPKAQFWLIWYELKYGHQVIWGKENILRYLPDWDGNDIPLEEAMKLMLNRGIGLWLAKQVCKNDFSNQIEFITRNIFKAVLAIGDSLLITMKRYHWSYQTRLELFEKYYDRQIETRFNIRELYREAIEYKLKPDTIFQSQQECKQKLDEVSELFEQVYYYIASIFFNHPIHNTRNYYALVEETLYREYRVKPIVKNLILNMRDFKGRNFLFDAYLRYPRWRLFYAFPWFMFNEHIDNDKLLIALGLDASKSIEQKQAAYLEIWHKYN